MIQRMSARLRRRVTVLAAVAAAASILGVGYAMSGSEPEPTLPEPDLTAEYTYVAGPDGEVLVCDGKQMKVKTSTLTGPPPLTPEEAVDMMAQPGYKPPTGKVARCGESGTLRWVDDDSLEAQQTP